MWLNIEWSINSFVHYTHYSNSRCNLNHAKHIVCDLLFNISRTMKGHDRTKVKWISYDEKQWYRRKDMFYLTTHSAHFYLWLFDIWHMFKDHIYNERGNPLPQLHGPVFPISNKGSYIYIIPHRGQYISMAFVTPVVEHWLERERAQWAHQMGSIQRPSELRHTTQW